MKPTRRCRNRIDITATRDSVSATPAIMVTAKSTPAPGTPLDIAKVVTNSASGHGIRPAITPTASPSPRVPITMRRSGFLQL
ncbi:MAG: hypothetical protein EOS67_23135 [Mesorhizobium sp.]|nr:MAG: hypothetical protein EOS67_23135 [Mesorhizobium sp.]